MPFSSQSSILFFDHWNLGKEFFLSSGGLKRLKQEYESFKKLKFLKTNGDFPPMLESEDLNPEYLSLQEDINLLEAKLAELEAILKNAKLIKLPPKEKQNVVDLGAKVAVEANNGQRLDFELVGCLEADPDLGRISNESPVGKALLGQKAGDEVAVNATVYKIKKITYPS